MMDLQRKVAIWGDSILKGVVFDDVKGAYELLTDNCAALVSRGLGLTIINRSKFGFTIDKGFENLARTLKSGLDADTVLLEYGGNDCDFDWAAVSEDPDQPHQPHTTLPRFRQILQQMIDLLRDHQIEPILMSLPPIVGDRYLDFLVSKGLNRDNLLRFLGDAHQIYRWHESYSLAVTQMAAANKCIYVPVRETFLTLRNSPDLICADGLHPNDRGHRLMQEVFTKLALA